MRSLSYYTGGRVYRVLLPLKRFPWVKRSYGNFRYLVHICSDCIPHVFVKRLVRYDSSVARQVPLCHATALPESASAEDILAALSKRGIEYHQGQHTFYVPPQRGLDLAIGPFVQDYPPDAGFKILKNIGAGDHHTYLNGGPKVHPWARRVLLGSPQDVFDGACLAEILELGPRAYDLATLRNGAMSLTCYVVQHVAGQSPSMDEYNAFMEKLQACIDQGILGVALPEGLDRGDFSPPDCNANLIRSGDGRCHYIDFQHFILKDRKKLIQSILDSEIEHLHFGQPHFLTREKFLYQEIPGLGRSAKRDTVKRWSIIKSLLDLQGISVKDRLLLDVCCNTGMMLASALSEGAFWGLGWDLPDVAAPANRIQRMLGNSRVQITGCHLDENYALTRDIPAHLQSRLTGSIVFYLAASQHVGFIKELASIPWETLVYEGHQGDRAEAVAKNLQRMTQQWGCDVLVERTVKDGHCGERPLALLMRRRQH